MGLGLITLQRGRYEVANPIYREVIPRVLSFDQQAQLVEETSWYVKPDGGLDLEKLLRAFQDFWRKDGHLAAERFLYREAGPHLMFMAFLQRVVNAGGRIEREYGLGRGALDLLVEWRGERHAIEGTLPTSQILMRVPHSEKHQRRRFKRCSAPKPRGSTQRVRRAGPFPGRAIGRRFTS